MKPLGAALLLLLLCSCSMLERHETAPTRDEEIADHPQILHNGRVSRTDMTLRGTKLGASRAAIPSQRILHTSDDGNWIVCRDGARYKVDPNGTITTLGVWDTSILDRLAITSPAELEKNFGKPDSTDRADPLTIYRYANGSVTVLWNTQEGRVNAVNVSK